MADWHLLGRRQLEGEGWACAGSGWQQLARRLAVD
uniref:Uncharacterized protein n=1 Tax=Caudovirales sp. ctTqA28 TaxID=2826775 RepID=A0A8S5MEB5_9CAUD|nr:MAG TPA: hypothetical protein [Caudovirales sp. ctTqA28]